MSEEGQLQDYSVDQAAGAIVLVLGAVASLLLVIWQSKCHCKINLCYLFQCERRPPNEEELKGLKDKAKELQNNRDKAKKDKDNADPERPTAPPPTPTPTPSPRSPTEPEPEPEAISSSWKKL
tara:strand:- start:1031 stop:1399 length:369 start_codon:yes stop_codon:yes gene_type:complete